MSPNFHEWLKREAARRGLTIKSLIQKSDISDALFYRMKAGKMTVSIRTLGKLALALGLSLEQVEEAAGFREISNTAA